MTHTARDSFVLGLNRANLQATISHLLERLSLSKADAKLEVLKRPLLSLQGPKASQALSSIAHCDLTSMQYGEFTLKTIAGADCMVWRRGFVGEDGFEISPSDQASASVIQSALAQHPAVKVTHVDEEEQWLVEDCLRVEAGLNLFSYEIRDDITPVEAGLAFAVHPSKRRSKDFPGARLILDQLKGRGLKRKRVGLIGSGSMEAGDMIYDLSGHHLIGEVTSGLFSPHFEANIAMGYIHLGTLQPDWAVHVTNGMALTVRSRESEGSTEAKICQLPFVPHSSLGRVKRQSPPIVTQG